jgi:hypothetical protein
LNVVTLELPSKYTALKLSSPSIATFKLQALRIATLEPASE